MWGTLFLTSAPAADIPLVTIGKTCTEMGTVTKEKRKLYDKNYRKVHKKKLNAQSRAYYEKHKEEIKAYGKVYKETHRKEMQVYRDTHKREKRNSDLKRLSDITLKDYEDMLKVQGSLCAICSYGIEGKNCHVDHNHRTGKVRGLLCSKCNTMLGYADDNILTLKNAIKYLKKGE